jgi:hypothetical protein
MEGTRRRPVWAVCAAVVVAAAVVSLVWTDTASTQIFATGWRCYPAKQPKGTPKFEPTDLVLNGTLQGTNAQALKPVLYCDPVSPGVVNATAAPSLVCYSIKDASGTPKFPGATVEVSDFELPFNGTLDLKKSKLFCSMAFGRPVL